MEEGEMLLDIECTCTETDAKSHADYINPNVSSYDYIYFNQLVIILKKFFFYKIQLLSAYIFNTILNSNNSNFKSPKN